MKHLLTAILFVLILGSASDAAVVIGFDQDGNGITDPGEMGVTNAIAGQTYSMDMIFAGQSDTLLSWGAYLGTNDSSAVSDVSFMFQIPPGWTEITPLRRTLAQEDTNAMTPEFLAYRTLSGASWIVAASDFNFPSLCDTVFSLAGTLSFTAEIDGCISWGIDPGDGVSKGSAMFTCDFVIPPSTAAAPNECNVSTATDDASWSDVKQLFR